MNSSMTYIKHLSELRGRLARVLLLFLLLFIGSFFFADELVQVVKENSLAKDLTWYALNITDAVRIYLQVAFMIALVITIPYALFEVWRFVSPGLKEEEQKVLIPFIPAAAILFIIGVLFAYYILFPMLVHFLIQIAAGMEAHPTYGIAQYFSFLFNICLPFGILFELPLVVMLLTRLGILHPVRLRKMRRYAYFALLIIAVSITPPEFIADMMVTVPLILLFEISLILSTLVYRKRLAQMNVEEI